jgi:hypothetical protein
MKSYTDIEQSRKLAKILPLESADMCYIQDLLAGCKYGEYKPYIGDLIPAYGQDKIRCWSLAALLNILNYPQLSKDKLGSGKTGWMVSVYPDNCRYDSCWHDNPIDACVDMIEKLNELKML